MEDGQSCCGSCSPFISALLARQRNSSLPSRGACRSQRASHSKIPDAYMAQQPPMETRCFPTLDLSSITPESLSPTSLLSGIITIKWPFSSSTQKLTFLLADPDPRKRAQDGQVKITLLGEAAQHLDQIESGEQISIAAPENTSPLIESESTTPRVKFHITFPQGCILLVLTHPPSHR